MPTRFPTKSHAGPAATLPVRLRRVAGTALAGLALALLLYAKGVPCFFAHAFHTPCPGCGSTRAVLCLLHGDIPGVLRMNVVAPFAAFLIGLVGVQGIVSMLEHGDFRDVGEGRLGYLLKRLLLLAAIVEIVVWIARFFGAFGGPVSV